MQDAKTHKAVNEFVVTTAILLTRKYILLCNPEYALRHGKDLLLFNILIFDYTFHKQYWT